MRIEEHHPDHTVVRVRTPLGEVRTVYRDIWEDGRLINRRIVEFPVKTVDDLVDRQRFRAEPTIMLSSSGFTELIKTWCGLPGTYYLIFNLGDHATDEFTPPPILNMIPRWQRISERLHSEGRFVHTLGRKFVRQKGDRYVRSEADTRYLRRDLPGGSDREGRGHLQARGRGLRTRGVRL